MNESPSSPPHLSLFLIEGLFALISIGLCAAWPSIGARWFSRIEYGFARLAKRQKLSIAVVGLIAFLLRLAILPLCPIPLPFVPDDFSFLLASDTFAHGRLTNPTPAMWMHFESIHITMQPTYMSMYFPAQGLILAAAKVLLGNPWFGLLCVMALMCSAICWMLQAWLPSNWALLGGMTAVLRLGLFSYWINTYTGAGCIAALGGALVLGAFPRIIRYTRNRDCLLLSLGIVLLLLSRPYEGLLVCLPVAIVLARWLLLVRIRPTAFVLVRRAALPLVFIISAVIWLGYYDQQAFGGPFTLPYTVDRNTYAASPYWIWEKPRLEPLYRHNALRQFYVEGELSVVKNYQTPKGFILQNFYKPLILIFFFAGMTLLPVLIMLPRVLLDRRIRFFLLSAMIWLPGMFIVIFLLPHYVAPFTAAIYLIGLQCMRHLRVWKPGGFPIGIGLVRLIVVSSLILAAVRAWAEPLHIAYAHWPGRPTWAWDWYGPGPFGAERARVESYLEELPGKQLILVRYSNNHDAANEWVYNDADLENSKVVWAREMDTTNNSELIRFYKGRTVWLVQPDSSPIAASSYPMSEISEGEMKMVTK